MTVKYFCDLCGKESQKLKYHDFTQWIQISEVREFGEEQFFSRFYVCDSCRNIYVHYAEMFIQTVKDVVNNNNGKSN